MKLITRKIILYSLSVALLLSMCIITPISFGWFFDGSTSPTQVEGAIIGSYFEYGDGSAEHPFGIAQPKQMYYFAWLQDLGYFNKVNNEGEISQYYFELSDKYGDTISMNTNETQYVLPPIGTVTYPFIGNFNGNGVTLSDVVIDNEYGEITDVPVAHDSAGITENYGVSIVGLFGVVGYIGANDNNGTTTVTSVGTYQTAVNSIYDFNLTSSIIKTTTPENSVTLVGILAGYVNGNISSVAVSNSSVSVANNLSKMSDKNNISDYGLVGYCEDAYKQRLYLSSIVATVPIETQNVLYKSTQTEGAGFGGSIQMKDMFDRLTIFNANTYAASGSYDSAVTILRDSDGRILNREVTATSNISSDGRYYYNETYPENGSYYRSDSTASYMYLTQAKMTVTNLKYNGSEEDGYKISYDGNYLTIIDGVLTNTTDADEACIWVYSSSKLYTYYPIVNLKYYLNYNGSLTISTTGSTNWTWSNNRFTCTYSSKTYALTFVNDGWSAALESYYLISDGNGNYLTYNGSITNSTTAANASKWTFSNTADVNNPSGTISTLYNGTTYNLRYNNGLTASTNQSTSWTNNNGRLYNGSYYIKFVNGSWEASSNSVTGYTIRNGNNYMNVVSGNTIGKANSIADYSTNNRTIWFATNDATDYGGSQPNGYLYTYINGTIYYLYRNGTSLELSTTNKTKWYNYSNGNIYERITNGNTTTYYNIHYASNTWYIYEGSSGYQTLTTATSNATIPSDPLTIVRGTTHNITRTSGKAKVIIKEADTVEGSKFYSAFPINASNTSPFTVSDGNTGYIVSGCYSNSALDIRISQYAASSIYVAVNESSSGYTTYTETIDNKLEVITALSKTVGDTTYSGWYRIKDNYNKNNTSYNTSITGKIANTRRLGYDVLGLTRYEDSRQSVRDTFVNSNYLYGLHFMDATLTLDHLLTLPKVKIEGKTYENYEVPNDCIDFNVKRSGFITVFAGTYYKSSSNTWNNTFFSLHQVFRYTNDDPEVINGIKKVNDIKDIKEIDKIYYPTGDSDDYIYKYVGDNSFDATGLTLAFDVVKWMSDCTDDSGTSMFVNNAVYYFEIPVNGGEYALGSVKNKDGAYLFYLDIAANSGRAEDKDRYDIAETFTYYKYDFEMPKGIQLTESGSSYDSNNPYETVIVQYKNGYSGTDLLNIEDNVFTYTAGSNKALTFVGGGINSDDPNESIYYPHGYYKKLVENITDVSRSTPQNDDIMKIETIDEYNSNGGFEKRTVVVTAGITSTNDPTEMIEIIRFDYTTSDYNNIIMRCVRAASYGSFNICFNKTVTISNVIITNANARVNFGSNTGSALNTVTSETSLANNVIDPVALQSGETGFTSENLYNKPTVGNNLVNVYYYSETDIKDVSTKTYTPAHLAYNQTTQSLVYDLTLTPSANETITAYARLLQTLPYAQSANTYVIASNGVSVQSISATINVTTATLSGQTLTTTKQKFTIPVQNNN